MSSLAKVCLLSGFSSTVASSTRKDKMVDFFPPSFVNAVRVNAGGGIEAS